MIANYTLALDVCGMQVGGTSSLTQISERLKSVETSLPEVRSQLSERLDNMRDTAETNFRLIMEAIVNLRSNIECRSGGMPPSPLEVAKCMHGSDIPVVNTVEGNSWKLTWYVQLVSHIMLAML